MTTGAPQDGPEKADGRDGDVAAGPGPAAASLGESVRTIHALARDLADVPTELRDAPRRAVTRPPEGLPGRDGHRARAVLRDVVWLVLVLAACGAVALAVSLTGL